MNKDFNQKKLLSFSEEKQLRVLYDLALFIDENDLLFNDKSFFKLTKYHSFLDNSGFDKIQRVNKEFKKINQDNRQFELYLMLLERLLGMSKKEYNKVVTTKDSSLRQKKTYPIVVVLDSLRSAHNIGAIIRSSECFGVEKIILSGLSPTPDDKQVRKTAMGSEVPWKKSENLIDEIKFFKNKGYKVFAIETSTDAVNINTVKALGPSVLIFGNEQYGVGLDLIDISDQLISIPMHGLKNSLNVSVCCGIVLNQFSHHFKDNSF